MQSSALSGEGVRLFFFRKDREDGLTFGPPNRLKIRDCLRKGIAINLNFLLWLMACKGDEKGWVFGKPIGGREGGGRAWEDKRLKKRVYGKEFALESSPRDVCNQGQNVCL